MDDLVILRDAWGQPDPPSPAAYATARAALLERPAAAGPARQRRTVGLAWRDPAGGGAPWRGSRRTRRLAVAGAGLALAAAVTVLAVQSGGSGPGITVQELAYRTAAVAAAGPNVRPGQWVYWQEKQIGGSPGGTFQSWTTADSRTAAYLDRGKVRILRPACSKVPARPGAASGCYFIGPPAVFGGTAGSPVSMSNEYGPMPVSYAGLSSLPRSPLALDRYLARLHLPGWGPAPFREFSIIEELVTTYAMPPALTAELYRSLSHIPGVTVDHHAIDVAGRTGIGLQIAVPPSIGGGWDELIINPHTYRLMGQQLTVPQATGAGRHVLSGTAILQRVLVSGPGVRP